MLSVKKAFDSGERTASQSEHLCRTNANLSDKGTARSPQVRRKIRAGESLTEVSKILRCGFRGRGCSRCNITTARYEKKACRTDWSGLGRTPVPKHFESLYIAAERIIRINKWIVRSIFIRFVIHSNKRFDKEDEKSIIQKINT